MKKISKFIIVATLLWEVFRNRDRIVKVYTRDETIAVDYGTKTEFYPKAECTHLLEFINNFSL